MTETVTTKQQEWAAAAATWMQQQIAKRQTKVVAWQTVGATA